jgi:metallo-beta-lactamase family protein
MSIADEQEMPGDRDRIALRMVKLTFLGAAQTVTGSKHLLEANGARVLVDCGLFQGLKELRELNWQPLPFEPETFDAVILTHAHIDHSGYLPRLVAGGFNGRIFCTPGTQNLCSLVLPDAGHLQEEDARDANKHGYTKHSPALPLFTEEDAQRTLTQFQPVGYERPVPVARGIELDFIDAGHLLGSAYARVRVNGQTILFGGDLGRYDRPVLPDPRTVEEADLLLVESTYGDRIHPDVDDAAVLADIINDTLERQGKVIIPSFAIGRVEEVLYWLRKIEQERRIPELPVYVDSPMSGKAITFYSDRLDSLDPDLRPERKHDRVFGTARLRVVESVEESKEVTANERPAIVISASGMATGGRVLHHLKRALPDPRNTVLFVGFQAIGTRGRDLVDGRREVRIHGHPVSVGARIEKVDSMSAHADQREMLRWLGGFKKAPRRTFLVHGEPVPMHALKHAIVSSLAWDVYMPQRGESVEA